MVRTFLVVFVMIMSGCSASDDRAESLVPENPTALNLSGPLSLEKLKKRKEKVKEFAALIKQKDWEQVVVEITEKDDGHEIRITDPTITTTTPKSIFNMKIVLKNGSQTSSFMSFYKRSHEKEEDATQIPIDEFERDDLAERYRKINLLDNSNALVASAVCKRGLVKKLRGLVESLLTREKSQIESQLKQHAEAESATTTTEVRHPNASDGSPVGTLYQESGTEKKEQESHGSCFLSSLTPAQRFSLILGSIVSAASVLTAVVTAGVALVRRIFSKQKDVKESTASESPALASNVRAAGNAKSSSRLFSKRAESDTSPPDSVDSEKEHVGDAEVGRGAQTEEGSSDKEESSDKDRPSDTNNNKSQTWFVTMLSVCGVLVVVLLSLVASYFCRCAKTSTDGISGCNAKPMGADNVASMPKKRAQGSEFAMFQNTTPILGY